MSSYVLDPELTTLAELFPTFEFTSETLAAIRANPDSMFSQPAEGVLAPRILSIPGRGDAPDVALYLYDPPREGDSLRAAVLHIHGGGMVLGSASTSKVTLAPKAQALGIVAVSVEYRLSPDTAFPGPQEDCYAALAWLFENAAELGIDPDRIVVMGESAGGGLAAALAIMARDRGEYRLAGQLLFYPMLDYRTGGPDDVWKNPVAGALIWTKEANQFGWKCLRGDYALDDERRGWFSPSLAADLTGLPPTYLATAGLDLFVDEDIDYARRLTAAGVPVDLEVYASAPHGFDVLETAEVAQRAQANLMSALKRLTSGKWSTSGDGRSPDRGISRRTA